MSKHVEKLVLVLLLTSILLVPAAANADGDCAPSVWNLDRQAGPAGTDSTDTLLMEDALGSKTQSGTVSIGDDETQIWVSDVTAASENVTFSEGQWSVFLISADGNFLVGGVFEVAVGRSTYNSSTKEWDFTSFGIPQLYQITTAAMSITAKYDTGQQTLLEGERLALQVTNKTGQSVTIDTSGEYVTEIPLGSSLSTPCCPAGNFTPELTTGILLGIGLLGLGGFIFIKRKRAGKASN